MLLINLRPSRIVPKRIVTNGCGYFIAEENEYKIGHVFKETCANSREIVAVTIKKTAGLYGRKSIILVCMANGPYKINPEFTFGYIVCDSGFTVIDII